MNDARISRDAVKVSYQCPKDGGIVLAEVKQSMIVCDEDGRHTARCVLCDGWVYINIHG